MVNDATEVHVCNLSRGFEESKFGIAYDIKEGEGTEYGGGRNGPKKLGRREK